MLKKISMSFNIVLILFWVFCLSINPIFSSDSEIRKNIRQAKETVFRLNFTNGVYTGSGFVINTLGKMITCAHVVDSSGGRGKYVKSLIAENYVTILLDSVKSFNTVITYNVTVDTVMPDIDIAILSVDLKAPQYNGISGLGLAIERIPYLGFLNTDSIWEGQEVFACAYIKDDFSIPKPVIAKGIISTIREKCYDLRMKNNVDIIQLDLNISRGNSGAPVFLPDNGRVIGIIDWGIFEDSKWQTGYAVAITTNQIIDKLRELKIPFDFK